MSKIISVSDYVYRELKKVKNGKSFSEIIIELLKKRSNKEKVLSFFGKRGIDEKRIKELKKYWKRWTERYA